ncbi:hypothetical protein N7476_002557 [Penicillium atrosanguineum]|uniref:Uncharacterized protein n=1 Tax=Penicillium atrosanguineum TaxID=1132637 RepID=A0A9W9U8C0_9EURO|nr:hypothetical protein N7476_002557 [Penicillium atrosanguineum]
MTATKNSNKSFSLSGSDFDQYETASWPIYNVSMPACNSSVDTGDWRVRLWEGPWWNTEGWDAFSYPEFRANFDGKHANLTLDGSYFANSIVKNGISPAVDPGSIMGRIQMRFSGILDAYHSDVLDVNSSTPTWLRTVGFGNNSLNIANDSKGTSLSKPHQWILLPFLFVLAFMLY